MRLSGYFESDGDFLMAGAPLHFCLCTVFPLPAPLTPLRYTTSYHISVCKAPHTTFPKLARCVCVCVCVCVCIPPAGFLVKFYQLKKVVREWKTGGRKKTCLSISFWWYCRQPRAGEYGLQCPVQTAQILPMAAVSVPRASATQSSYAGVAYFRCPTSINNKEVK